jgi:hypothetical protein
VGTLTRSVGNEGETKGKIAWICETVDVCVCVCVCGINLEKQGLLRSTVSCQT